MPCKTISIGGATYDLFVRTDTNTVDTVHDRKAFILPLGDKIRVQDVIETCGGGACNTAVGFARLGCNASFCGVLGSDQWGQALMENFQAERVDTRCITTVEDEVSSFSIILSASGGERVILYTPGTNEHLHDATFQRDTVADMDWVYLNHIQENSCVIEDDLIQILTEDEDVHFTWNPGGCQIDMGAQEAHNRKLLSQTDALQLNLEEALQFTKTSTLLDALKELVAIGTHIVCITDGSKGTTATDGKHVYHCPIIESEDVRDTTGAGDAFGTGFSWALVEQMDLPTALRAGTINASSVVSHIGAQKGLLTDTEMHEQLENCSLDVAVNALES